MVVRAWKHIRAGEGACDRDTVRLVIKYSQQVWAGLLEGVDLGHQVNQDDRQKYKPRTSTNKKKETRQRLFKSIYCQKKSSEESFLIHSDGLRTQNLPTTG